MDDLPPLYARWMREQVGADLPREEVATCAQCVMLSAGNTVEATTFFEPTTKCCTYLPELHNFLVGQILLDDDVHPAGRESVIKRIADGNEVTPLGLGRPRSYLLLYQEGGDVLFGRSKGMRCPHYLDGGLCGVWQHRESTCATWFCKHVRGEVGKRQWRAVRRVLRQVELDLAWWCVGDSGLDSAAVAALLDRHRSSPRVTVAEVDGTQGNAQRDLWGSWFGREHQFFEQCAARVEALSWREVVAICGPSVAVAATVLSDRARTDAASILPSPLHLRPLTINRVAEGTCVVTTYNEYDPITLPLALLEALDAFDGRPTETVLASLREDRGVDLDVDLVMRLIDFGVLSGS